MNFVSSWFWRLAKVILNRDNILKKATMVGVGSISEKTTFNNGNSWGSHKHFDLHSFPERYTYYLYNHMSACSSLAAKTQQTKDSVQVSRMFYRWMDGGWIGQEKSLFWSLVSRVESFNSHFAVVVELDTKDAIVLSTGKQIQRLSR